MGVRETPSRATSGSSDIRSPGANSPRISDSRRLNRARAAWEATSEEPGFYAEAAVDGNRATVWAPDAAQGSLTADLGRPTRIARIDVAWTEPPPASFKILVSADGGSWTAVDAAFAFPHPIEARYVRVDVAAAGGDRRTGLREMTVIRE